jgi:hypothetical protein
VNFQGDFEGLALASIFQLLCNDEKTGILTVTGNDDTSRVFFNNGTIVYATASLKEARLGFLLRTNGVISEQQLKKCLDLAKESKTHLGKILVDKGYISLETLKKYNVLQVETILYNLFFCKKGKFDYKDEKLNLKGMIVIQLNPMKLILEASRRIDELSVLKKCIPSDKMVYKMSGTVPNKNEIKLNANEWCVLSLVDGTRTVRQIINQSGYDDFAVYKILFSVISSGMIVEKEEVSLNGEGDEGDYSAIITVYGDLISVILKTLTDELGDHTSDIFEDAKKDLPEQFQQILKTYSPYNDKRPNLMQISNAMVHVSPAEDRRKILITGFNQYCYRILKNMGNILGTETLLNVVDDVEKMLSYVAKYQTSSVEKDKIVNDFRTIILEIKTEFKPKSRGGIFSFFS